MGEALEGGCTCGKVRYRLNSDPMFVHCCHCRWCQRETGAAFALNALEEDRKACMGAGMDDYLTKPVSFEALALTVARWGGQPNEP